MRFFEWIEENGGAEGVSELLGITYFGVRRWLRGDSYPKPETMHEIVARTKGKVDYNAIMTETWAARKKWGQARNFDRKLGLKRTESA